jgi:hypothetical protein
MTGEPISAVIPAARDSASNILSGAAAPAKRCRPMGSTNCFTARVT